MLVAILEVFALATGCATEATESANTAHEARLASMHTVAPKDALAPEADPLAAERAALEKQRARVEALRTQVAQLQAARGAAPAPRSTRRDGKTGRSAKASKTAESGGAGRKRIVLDDPDGDPI